MEFLEYEKMASSLDRFESPSPTEFKKVEWAVTEKIHGANFSFHTDGVTVKAARRRAFLHNGENFFSHLKADFMNDCPEKIKALFPIVEEAVGEKISQLTVYGELYGGKYDHPDISRTSGGKRVKPVQQEIQYSPEIRFCGFDISYHKENVDESPNDPDENDDEDNGLNKHKYLDFETTLKLFDQLEIPYMKPLFVGKVNAAFDYELGFDSFLPKQLGLPELAKGSNKAEGIVIRPMKEMVGMAKKQQERVMVKLKIPEFDERRDQKGKIVQERCKQMPDNKPKSGKGKSVGRPDKVLLPRLAAMATENRLISAISKTGHPDTDEDEKRVVDEMFDDILVDAFDNLPENETLWECLDANRKENVSKSIRAKISAQIKRYKQKQQDDGNDSS